MIRMKLATQWKTRRKEHNWVTSKIVSASFTYSVPLQENHEIETNF